MIELGRSSMLRYLNDSFILDNSVMACTVGILCSKGLNLGSHPDVALSPSVIFVRGRRKRGKVKWC